MLREQKTVKTGCPYEGKLEIESNKGVRSIEALENKREDNAGWLLEVMLQRDNMNTAFKKVKQNNGASGIDGMTIKEMLPYLKENKEEFLESIRKGKYKPKPVRRVEIPKPDGGVRLLGVPTVIDRMVQQALVQILTPIFEPIFSENSYGFRPLRNAHQAINKAKEYYEEGYKYVVDIDLAKYFDTVNHDILINMIREEVEDESIVRLIKKFLKSGVMKDGVISATTEGTPQGGNLSPLLSNIYLTKFDRMLEERGHHFVRYADDCNIYVKSRRAAERVMVSCTKYLEGKLKLKVNTEKSQIGSPLKLKFLGFSLYEIKSKIGIRAHEKPIKRFKKKLKEKMSRKKVKNIEAALYKLKEYTTGWLRYYAIADMGSRMKEINQWLRRRIRMCIWKQWKKIKTKYENLMKLGVGKGKAWEWANTSKKYWHIANSFILSTTLTNEYLTSLGYDDISLRYKALHSNY